MCRSKVAQISVRTLFICVDDTSLNFCAKTNETMIFYDFLAINLAIALFMLKKKSKKQNPFFAWASPLMTFGLIV